LDGETGIYHRAAGVKRREKRVATHFTRTPGDDSSYDNFGKK
jgi:hypothetical protein